MYKNCFKDNCRMQNDIFGDLLYPPIFLILKEIQNMWFLKNEWLVLS
jgi:hypothetical protein